MKNSSKPKMKDYSFIYISKWEIEGFPHYAFLVDKRLFNYKTNRFSKKRVKKYSIGYTLNGTFYTLKKLKPLTSLVVAESNNLLHPQKSVKKLYDFLQKTG